MSQKNLKRLFPTDQSMVVIIDDRSDVWDDSPNLVKVVPCEYIVSAALETPLQCPRTCTYRTQGIS
jgi:TFIIF-interacting CTD phosphatase-like protein